MALPDDRGGQQREQRKSLAALGQNMLLALVITYLLMAALFESFAYPLVILGAINILYGALCALALGFTACAKNEGLMLVLVFAVGRGHVSAFLRKPSLVLLGEVSFSIYMVHEVLLRYYVYLGGRRLELSAWIQYPVFWVVVLLSAYATWRYRCSVRR